MSADAHVACAQDIVLGLDEKPEVVAEWEGKVVLYEPVIGQPEWHKLRINETLDEVRKDIEALLVRIAAEGTKQ